MKKQIPALVLTIISIILGLALNAARQENEQLKKHITDLEAVAEQAADVEPASNEAIPVAELPAEVAQAAGPAQEISPLEETSAPEAESKKESNRRIMRNMARTIEENPTINKMVEASQRGAIGALYSDMIEYLNMDAEETRYFMDLLMYRQMANVDAHMKMASGNLSEEEKLALQEATRQANETTRSEMANFLNDSDDFEEFKFYEETIGERMMLSQMDQKLGDAALSDEAYREVLEVMYDERENYAWSTDLHDNEIRDLSPERFSRNNISKHIADMKTLGEQMDRRMQGILTPEQLAAWRESGEAMQALIEGQLIQANQAFGGE